MLSTEKSDFLIIGQGLAGTLLAHFLLKKNQRIKVLDVLLPGAASAVAAGVINPVTGRRIVKSWRFEALMLIARQTYLELETLLDIQIWKETSIVRALHNTFEENEWERRSQFPEHEKYIAAEADTAELTGKINPPYGWGEIQGCAQVDVPALLNAFRLFLKKKELLIEDIFDYQQVTVENNAVFYKNLKAGKVIFCEGAAAVQNPFFNSLPFVPTKGELLLIRIPGVRFSKIIKHHLFLIPLHDDLYWAGSTSRFEYDGPLPSEEQKEILLEKLQKTLQVPFEIVAHQAGIRPTVSDIRPFLGVHPQHPGLAIFNGLGTKGTSIGPFFAEQMAGFLLGENRLDAEVDIGRFHPPDAATAYPLAI